MDAEPTLPLNPCQWEPAFYAAPTGTGGRLPPAAAHGWAAYRGSGPPKAKTIRHCNFCGSTAHLMRGCTFGSSLAREQQFLRCDKCPGAPTSQCFVRRFVVPLHRARADFALDDLREGRIDLAARLVVAALVCSQRLRHNAQLWLPLYATQAWNPRLADPRQVCYSHVRASPWTGLATPSRPPCASRAGWCAASTPCDPKPEPKPKRRSLTPTLTRCAGSAPARGKPRSPRYLVITPHRCAASTPASRSPPPG